DDSIMERFLEGEEIPMEELKKALRTGTVSNKIVPVLCGSSFKNKGVQFHCDCVVDYLPSPLDVEAIAGIDPHNEAEKLRKPSDEEPLSALAFKIASDKFVGRLTYIRLYSGVLKKGSSVSIAYRDPQTNDLRTRSERVGRILEM